MSKPRATVIKTKRCVIFADSQRPSYLSHVAQAENYATGFILIRSSLLSNTSSTTSGAAALLSGTASTSATCFLAPFLRHGNHAHSPREIPLPSPGIARPPQDERLGPKFRPQEIRLRLQPQQRRTPGKRHGASHSHSHSTSPVSMDRPTATSTGAGAAAEHEHERCACERMRP